MTRSTEYRDVVVVGARCAGAATAMMVARAGLDVLALDRASFPSDVLSTHGIARGGVVQLARWGLLGDVLASGAPAVREVELHRGGERQVRALRASAGVDCLVAPRRFVLDALLVDAARAAGAEVREGVTVTGLLRDASGRVAGVGVRDRHGHATEVRARVVVGADGLRSRVAQWVGAPVVEGFDHDTATFCTYVGDVDWRGFEFHVAHRALAGVFPTHGAEASVWLCRPTDLLADVRAAGRDREQAFLAQLDVLAPPLASRVRHGRLTAPVRGAIGMPNHARRAVGPGWALVGDAGYHRDPVTGHGITDAFRDAELLATALVDALRGLAPEAEALDGYRRRRDAALRPTFDLTRALTGYPPTDRFVELQRELARALDTEAAELASLPRGGSVAAA
jgi:flavin-dependent dehydrogenase